MHDSHAVAPVSPWRVPPSHSVHVECGLSIKSSTKTPVDLRGNLDAESESGLVTFEDLRVDGPLGAVVTLRVRCSFGVYQLPDIEGTVTIQDTVLEWVAEPPTMLIPSSVGAVEPIAAPVTLRLLNATGGTMVTDSSSVCVMSVASWDGQGDAPVLVSPASATMVSGLATFDSVAVSGALGSVVKLTVACREPVACVSAVTDCGR